MRTTALIAVLFVAGPSTAAELCAGMERGTEPQYQILEADLDRASAIHAADRLREMVARGDVDGEYYFGVLNQLKIVKGHVLLSQAHSDREELGPDSIDARESAASFCAWLEKDGFWYD